MQHLVRCGCSTTVTKSSKSITIFFTLHYKNKNKKKYTAISLETFMEHFREKNKSIRGQELAWSQEYHYLTVPPPITMSRRFFLYLQCRYNLINLLSHRAYYSVNSFFFLYKPNLSKSIILKTINSPSKMISDMKM